MKWLWILVMLGDTAHSTCFVDTVVGEKGDVFETPQSLDEIHCKTICADSDKCKSFNFHANVCKLFSTPTKTFKCSNPYRELIKRTDASECEDLEVTYSLSENYTSNPDLPANTTTVDVNVDRSPPCGDKVTELDAILIDGSRKTLFAHPTTTIFWDSKLGVWIYQLNNNKAYLHAAKCIQPPVIATTESLETTTESKAPTTTTKKSASPTPPPPAKTAGGCFAEIPLCHCSSFSSPVQVIVDEGKGELTCPPNHSIAAGTPCNPNAPCASVPMAMTTVKCVSKTWLFEGSVQQRMSRGPKWVAATAGNLWGHRILGAFSFFRQCEGSVQPCIIMGHGGRRRRGQGPNAQSCPTSPTTATCENKAWVMNGIGYPSANFKASCIIR